MLKYRISLGLRVLGIICLFPAYLCTVLGPSPRPTLRSCSGEIYDPVMSSREKMLFDFSSSESLDAWVEQSDVVRTVGMSKAVIALQKTRIFQRAILFTLLNPQPNGAGFAGVRTETTLNLDGFQKIQLNVRGQGANSGYKIVLRHRNEDEEPYPTYEQLFDAPMNLFGCVNLPISDFKPFYRGRALNSSEAEPLDILNITNFGVQMYGGVYLPIKQSGASSLEIDWIKAVK